MTSRLGALLAAAHPIPGAGVTAVTVLLGVAAGLDPPRVVLLGAALAADQLSVGLSNDWIDAERDRAAGRRDKPVALGRIGVGTVRAVAIASAAAAIALTAPLGPLATLVHAIALGSAWAYNALLKRTPLSPLPYLVSFGLLPAIVTLAAREPAWPAPWVLGAGALLGLGAHLVNVLPDLEDDRRTGVRGLPHRIGRRASTALAWAALLGAIALLAAGIGLGSPLAIAGVAAAVALATAGIALGALRPDSRAPFRIVIATALLAVILLVAAGPGLRA